MAPPLTIRAATRGDAPGVLAIYAPIVESSAITFETETPSLDEIEARIERGLVDYAWLVAEQDGAVLGYAYAGMLRLRTAYRAAVETSVYIAPGKQRSGLASQLYQALFAALARREFHTALAAITLPNEASVRFHETQGFTAVGRFREVGTKFGQWHDVGWWQKML
ncbi:MAG: arsinothricin resistance N-acetyltransferase ArsN1 family B [Pseudomonadota bacterium]